MRNTIISCGGEVHFQTKMVALETDGNEVVGVKAVSSYEGGQQEKTFKGPVILATGHSARDVYQHFHENNIEMEAKGIAVGVRLEHPSELIDQIQYHNKNGRGKYLPAAEYAFVTQVEGRGVYSFCMCPGGFVIPSATGPQQIVTNGMSPANRGTKWSNAGRRRLIAHDALSRAIRKRYLATGKHAPNSSCTTYVRLCKQAFVVRFT